MDSNSEDLFIKPGNQERGWNDPPQFSYGLQTRGAHKNIMLTRRAPPAGSSTPMTPPSSAMTSPRSSVAPPQCSSVLPPPSGSSVVTPSASGPVRAQSESVQSEAEPDVEEVMLVLNAALKACRQNPQHTSAQVCNDVAKRLALFENSWRCCRLSLVVRRRMKKLSSDLKFGHFDAADDTHRSLMVDHVTEVSQWMVGIKRLIAEVRQLHPDQLRALSQDPNQEFDRDKETKDTTPECTIQDPMSINHTDLQ